MEAFFEYLNSLSLISLFLLFLLENISLAVIAVTLGFVFDDLVKEMMRLITKQEIYWACSTIFFNTVVTVTGYLLFKYGFIVFHLDFDLIEILVDLVVLTLAMPHLGLWHTERNLLSLFHWAVRKLSFLYTYHDLHHHYSTPTAISLFVLHPIEVLGFGALWLFLLNGIDFSIYAVMLYLTFNVAMGIIGHLRKEFVPVALKNNV